MVDKAQSAPKPRGNEVSNLQHLLPPKLREGWCVLPRFVLYQLFGVGALFGAGISLTLAGWIVDNKIMTRAWPVALVAMLAQKWMLRRTEKRYESEAHANQPHP
jgi:hypothetical protein